MSTNNKRNKNLLKLSSATKIHAQNIFQVFFCASIIKRTKTELRCLSPQANYTDRATAACRRSQCQLLLREGVAWSAQRIHTAVNLGFLDRI
jgi:hypothetical protein